MTNALLQTVNLSSSRRPKIAIFIESCAAGSGRHAADLAYYLAALQYDVHLLYSPVYVDDRFRKSLADFERQGGYPVKVNLRHNVDPTDIGAVREVRRYLAGQGPFDILHCHSTKAGFVGRLAALGLGIRTIYTPNAFLSMSPVSDPISSLGARVIERTLSRVTDKLICVSDEELQHAASVLGVSTHKTRLIPNGISLADAYAVRSHRPIVRRELGLSEADVCIGTVGRLVKQKAFGVLIEAFGLAASQLRANVKLIIVGAGPLMESHKALAKKRFVQDRVKFTGQLPGLRTMSSFDIFALSSCYEGHPYALIEALAMGLPVVTTAVGGAKASVQDGVNGFVAPIGDARVIAKHLVTLANSPSLREQMSHASLKRAKSFTLEAMTDRTIQVYEEALPTRTPIRYAASAGR